MAGAVLPWRFDAYQPGLEGDHDELGAVLDAQFRHGALDVGSVVGIVRVKAVARTADAVRTPAEYSIRRPRAIKHRPVHRSHPSHGRHLFD
ncbi:hypothetical protein ACIBJI_14055 [Nocardia sp. NPDC050408]|uniref:hypothetical protein n=1 Tax=unclassified Nocardia TaxID=2637762 RepID=UPI00341ED291